MSSSSSPRPLAAKLGITPGDVVVLLDMPDEVQLELPDGFSVRRQARGRASVILAFFTEAAALGRRLERLATMIAPDGGLWVAWPKRSSGVPTDLTDHAVRDLALPMGLVDNKVCAIDATWTGLRLVWRLEHR